MALCTVTGIVYLPTGEPARSRVFVFSPANRSIYPDNFGGVLPDPVWVKTNRDGLLTVTLLTGTYVVQSDVYSGSVVVPDAESANLYEILGGGGDIPNAPSVITAPSVSTSTAATGSPITLSLGEWDGGTTIGVLTQNGVNRTSDIVGGVWTPAVTGDFTWVVTATGPGGVTSYPAISGSVLVPLVQSSAIYVDHTDAPSGVMTGLTARGTIAPVFSLTGTGADVVMGTTGMRFSNGKYFRCQTGLPATQYRTAKILMDLTIEGDPLATAYAFLLDLIPAGSRAEVRIGWKDVSKPSAGYLMGAYGPNASLLRSTLYQSAGQRFTISYAFDMSTGEMVLTDADGFTETIIATAPYEPIQLSDIRIGQGCNMTLHALAVVLEAV